MILQLIDGSQRAIPVAAATAGSKASAVTLSYYDLVNILHLGDANKVCEYMQLLAARVYPAHPREHDFDQQRRSVEDHNRRLQGSAAIDNFKPSQFTTPPEQLG